jgi:hypothetical protein
MADDLACSDCPLYDVTATLTGVLLAVPSHHDGGCGHLGCCHLLTILPSSRSRMLMLREPRSPPADLGHGDRTGWASRPVKG